MSGEMPTPDLILVDGSSYLFRAFHALPDLTTSSGQHTGAIRGVISMVRKLMSDYPTSRIIMVFDAKGKTFRNDLYPEYKAHRPPMPEELREQIEPIHALIRAMGLPLVIIEGVEADDVIGTLARQAAERGLNTLISTGDKDMAQLVNDHVTLMNTMTGEFLDAAAVESKFGVRPDQIVDFLALTGDTADNIPGVTKCGPKTAAKWLAEYGTLDAIMAHADQIKGKIGENLRAALDQLPLSRELTRIRLDVDLPLGLDDLKPDPADAERLKDWFRQLEFKSWLRELENGDASGSSESVTDAGAPEAPPLSTEHYQVILTEEALGALLDALKQAPEWALDTETTSLNSMEARIVGLSFCIEAGHAFYLPLAHDYPGAPDQLDLEPCLAQLRPLLEDPTLRKIGQNLKYDAHVLANHGITLRGIAEDTMLESYVLDAAGSRHDMDSLSLKHLQHKAVSFEDIAGKGKKQLTFNQIDIDTAARYAAEDADVTLRLHQTLRPKLAATPSLEKVYTDIEMPLVPVLLRMERNGACVDAQKLLEQSQQLAERMAELEKQAHELAGEPFNLGSTKQLQHIFYDKLGYEVLKKTPKGQPSTAEPVLQELAEKYELPAVILEHRSLSKLKSTYTDKLPQQINPRTGRIHTSYHQAVTATGRLSSSDPNLQNIPVRTEEGRRIRQAFVAPEGKVLISADYSQIELRIMAHLSGDESLIDAFRHGRDIHSATAAEIFGVPLEAVTSDQRRKAKAINFGLIYGMSAFGLARQINVGRDEAATYMDTYFARYPGVKAYMERIRQQAMEQGYVETLFGRRLYLPDMQSRNRMRQQAAERAAINAPMQGTAADIIKRAMIAVDDWLQSAGTPAMMILQVHDELILEVPEAEAPAVAQHLT
ncbi:MAG: DNA polymerase I, partial [Gammaproteobacteria bacterium]